MRREDFYLLIIGKDCLDIGILLFEIVTTRLSQSNSSRNSSKLFVDEYAKVTNIFSAKDLKFRYKYDIPGESRLNLY